jgi:hypothetical protein
VPARDEGRKPPAPPPPRCSAAAASAAWNGDGARLVVLPAAPPMPGAPAPGPVMLLVVVSVDMLACPVA